MTEYTTNTYMRDALTCPRCQVKGTIRPTRDELHPFAFFLDCDHKHGGGCGLLGRFDPDPELWVGQDPVVCVRILQAWLDGLQVSDQPGDAVSRLGAIERKDREIEAMRAVVGKLISSVHRVYHCEAAELDWTQCPYPTCCEARASLGIPEIQ